MNNRNWKPFMVFGMIIGLMFFLGLGFFALMFFKSLTAPARRMI